MNQHVIAQIVAEVLRQPSIQTLLQQADKRQVHTQPSVMASITDPRTGKQWQYPLSRLRAVQNQQIRLVACGRYRREQMYRVLDPHGEFTIGTRKLRACLAHPRV